MEIALLKALFCELGLSSIRGKSKIFDRATTMLVHHFLVGGITFGESLL
jgi:hypothetical protein